MSRTQKIIIADTSCIILLHKINEFDLLRKLFGKIFVTSEICRDFGSALPDWVNLKDPVNISAQKVLLASVDQGEASAIALALEEVDPLLILDDKKARRLASSLNLKITGSLGILVEAKIEGYLTDIHAVIQKIKKTDFHLSDELELKMIELSEIRPE